MTQSSLSLTAPVACACAPPRRPRSRRAAALATGPEEPQASVKLVTGEEMRLSLPAIESLLRERSLGCLAPYRLPSQFQKARHLTGKYFFEKTRSLVWFESMLEERNLVLLDFDRDVSAVAPQPLELYFDESFEEAESHIPDFLCQLVDERFRVVDVKPRERASKPEIDAIFAETARLCERVGWEHRVVVEPQPTFFANVSLLHAYRRQLFAAAEINELLRLCAHPRTISELDELLGGAYYARPLIFHLLWHHKLEADLDHLIGSATAVWAAGLDEQGSAPSWPPASEYSEAA